MIYVSCIARYIKEVAYEFNANAERDFRRMSACCHIRGEIYGYEMTKVLAGYGFSDISEGSIYPILLRMQKEKWVETELKRSASGPKRKYYRLTPLGEAELQSFIGRWKALSGNVNALLEKN